MLSRHSVASASVHGCCTLRCRPPLRSSFEPSQSKPRLRVRPILLSSISTPPFRFRSTKRKNHLRPKILKTRTKPYPEDPISPPHLSIPENLPQIDSACEIPTGGDETCSVAAGGTEKVEELQVQETSGVAEEYSGLIGNISTMDVLKYGMYLVGFFVFQTICTVWLLGTPNSTDKDGSLDRLNLGENGIDERKRLLSSNVSSVGHINEFELEEKIAEIRAMAREARKSEEELRGGDIVEESTNSRDGVGIEDEIGALLAKYLEEVEF